MSEMKLRRYKTDPGSTVKSIDPEVLMGMMFQSSDLEVRIPLNLNVLDRNTIPQVMNPCKP